MGSTSAASPVPASRTGRRDGLVRRIGTDERQICDDSDIGRAVGDARAPRVDRRHAQYGRLRGLCRGDDRAQRNGGGGRTLLHLGVRVSARDHGYLDPLAFLPARPSRPRRFRNGSRPRRRRFPPLQTPPHRKLPLRLDRRVRRCSKSRRARTRSSPSRIRETLNPAQIRCWPKRPRPRLCPSTDPLRRSGSLSRRPRNCRPKRLCHRRPRRPAVVTWRLPQTLGRWSDRLRKNRVRNRPVRNRGRPRVNRRPPIVPKQAACQPSGLGLVKDAASEVPAQSGSAAAANVGSAKVEWVSRTPVRLRRGGRRR